jgi:zinc/manganese transport system permease protein
VLFSISPVWGLLLFSSVGGIIIAILGPRAAHRDTQIGIVLAFFLGLGVLFISLYRGYATEAYSILFGEILGISSSDVIVTLVAGVIILSILSIVYRPLLFASLDEDVAEAKGVPMFFLGIVFMIIVAATVSFAVQVVGVLLIFSLIVTPAATGQRLARRPRQAIAISVLLALAATWLGLFVAFFTPYPVSFFITGIVFAVYLIVRVAPRISGRPRGEVPESDI